MTWHAAYRAQVLAPDYHFAVRRLRHHFIDAMTAHLDTVLAMPAFAGTADQTRGAALRASLVGLHEVDAPEQDEDVPDLYFALQRELERDHGETVGLIRVGLSRNDLDMTVYKMHGRELSLARGRSLLSLRRSLLSRAATHLETVIIAQTHHQPGQPTTVAHYLAAVEAQLARDHERLVQAFERMNRCPLGAAALAGTSHPLDRQQTAGALGFDGPVENTYDAVASADWELDLAAVASSIALGLGRFVVDLLAWAAQGLYRLDDGLVQGSSIMPQKRNPVALEHARTRLSRVVGSAGLVAFSHHNIPFADLNDFGPDIQGALLVQHSQLMGALELVAACLEHGEFVEDGLKKAAAVTDTTATELADVLAREAGLAFPAAHRLVAALVVEMQAEGRPLTMATPDDLVDCGGPVLSAETISAALDPLAFVSRRDGLGMPAKTAMATQLSAAGRRLADADAALQARVAALDLATTRLRAGAAPTIR